MIYVLFILLIIFTWLTYSYKKDIFHPICLICLSFCFSVFCAVLNIDNWGINLSESTVFLIISGIISFILPSIFTKKPKKCEKKPIENSEIYVSKNILKFFLFIQFIFLILFIIWMKNYFGSLSNIFNSNLMTEFRFEKSFNQAIEFPWYINQGIKFSKAFVYVITFIYINNSVVNRLKKQKNKHKILLNLSIIMYALQTILTGGRSELILYIIFVSSLYFFIYNHYNKKSGTKIGANSLKILFIIALVLYAFSASRTLVGRTSEDDPVSYISKYFGGSIQLFDDYIKNPAPKSQIFGKETFYSVNKFLGQLKIINADYTIHLEFRNPNGVGLGNVYTAFRRMYQDFGLFGIITLNLIHGTIMALWYKKIYSSPKITFSLQLILYFILLHTVVLMPFSDFFFSTALSINYVNTIIYMLIIIFILKKYNLNIR